MSNPGTIDSMLQRAQEKGIPMAQKPSQPLHKSDMKPKEDKWKEGEVGGDISKDVVHEGKTAKAVTLFKTLQKQSDKMAKMQTDPLTKALPGAPAPAMPPPMPAPIPPPPTTPGNISRVLSGFKGAPKAPMGLAKTGDVAPPPPAAPEEFTQAGAPTPVTAAPAQPLMKTKDPLQPPKAPGTTKPSQPSTTVTVKMAKSVPGHLGSGDTATVPVEQHYWKPGDPGQSGNWNPKDRAPEVDKLAKGDVVDIKDKKVVSSDTHPAPQAAVKAQHKPTAKEWLVHMRANTAAGTGTDIAALAKPRLVKGDVVQMPKKGPIPESSMSTHDNPELHRALQSTGPLPEHHHDLIWKALGESEALMDDQKYPTLPEDVLNYHSNFIEAAHNRLVNDQAAHKRPVHQRAKLSLVKSRMQKSGKWPVPGMVPPSGDKSYDSLKKVYASDAQRRFFHSPGAKKAGITQAEVKEFDRASKGKDLPERVAKAAPESYNVHTACASILGKCMEHMRAGKLAKTNQADPGGSAAPTPSSDDLTVQPPEITSGAY